MEIECVFCGTLLEEDEKKQYCCNICQSKIDFISKVKKVDIATEKMQKACIRYLHKDLNYLDERKNVIEKIRKNGYVFSSIPEICFALQLEKEQIKYKPNYKIGNHRVDFILPGMKRIIEVDGEIYHKDEDKDFLRERAIMRVVGEEYEIVRIPASYIPNYIVKDLKESIEFVVGKRDLDGRFRDTRWDNKYWEQYFSLQRYLKNGGKRYGY